MTRKGQQSDEGALGNWSAYLEKHQKWIERGFQFTRLAVQEPYGVMILQVTMVFVLCLPFVYFDCRVIAGSCLLHSVHHPLSV